MMELMWCYEPLCESLLVQAGLHFVGLGSYLLLFPATSKYCTFVCNVFFLLLCGER